MRNWVTCCLRCFGYNVEPDKNDAPTEEEEEEEDDYNFRYVIQQTLLSGLKETVDYACDLVKCNKHKVDEHIVSYFGALVRDGFYIEQCMETLVKDCGAFGYREAVALIRENPHLLTDELLMIVQEDVRRQFVDMCLTTRHHMPIQGCRKKQLFVKTPNM